MKNLKFNTHDYNILNIGTRSCSARNFDEYNIIMYILYIYVKYNLGV